MDVFVAMTTVIVSHAVHTAYVGMTTVTVCHAAGGIITLGPLITTAISNGLIGTTAVQGLVSELDHRGFMAGVGNHRWS